MPKPVTSPNAAAEDREKTMALCDVELRPAASVLFRAASIFNTSARIAASVRGTPSPAVLPSVTVLDRGNVPERFEETTVIEPINPGQGRELHILEVPPRPLPANHLRLEQADHRLGQSLSDTTGVPTRMRSI